jgi:hypothetical protein
MIRLRLCIIMLAALCVPTLFAQTSDAGSRPFSFINLDFDARTMAMGGASVAMPNGIYGTFSNPASAGFENKREAMCGFRSIALDAFGGPIGFSMPYSSFGTFSFNLYTVSGGTLNEVAEGLDGSPVQTGAVARWYSTAGSISWGKIVWDNVALGAGIRGFHEGGSWSEGSFSADAASFQFGVQYRMFDARLILGLSVANLGVMLSNFSDDINDLSLPQTITAGVSYTPYYMPSLRIALDIKQVAGNDLMYLPGFEFALDKRYFFVRAGYRFSERDLEEQIRALQGQSSDGYVASTWYGPSFGIGLKHSIGVYKLNIDAAVQMTELGVVPALTLLLIY